MADKELGDLTAAGTLGGTETLYIVDVDGNSRKLALSDLKTFVNTDPSVVPSSEPWRGGRVARTSDLSISNNAATAVTWQSASIDTDTVWSSGTPTRLTVPIGVTKVHLRYGGRWAANTTGVRQIYMTKNGANFAGAGAMFMNAGSNLNHQLNVTSGVISVSAGDYFEAGAFQNSGGSLSLVAHETTWFEMEIVEAS
jgi:hypothetical protein